MTSRQGSRCSIPELLDRIRTASVAAGRPADAVRAVYSVPVRLDPRARNTAGSAADVIEQLYGCPAATSAG